MGKMEKALEELVKDLSPASRELARQFVESLIDRDRVAPSGKPDFAWVGALRELQSRYTSVELQHQVARWRSEGA